MTESTDMLNEAKRLFEAHDWGGSAKLYRQVLDTHEDDSEAYHGLSEAYYGLGPVALATGDDETATKCFEATLEIDPSNSNALYYLGQLAQQSGEAVKAIGLYGAAVSANPEHRSALAALAQMAQTSQPAAESTSSPGSLEPRRQEQAQPTSTAIPAPPRPPQFRDSYVGVVHDLQRMLYPRGPGLPLQVVTFLLQTYDQEGKPQPTLSVELRATSVKGVLGNDHWVEIPRSAKKKKGNLRPKRIRNLTTDSDISLGHFFA